MVAASQTEHLPSLKDTRNRKCDQPSISSDFKEIGGNAGLESATENRPDNTEADFVTVVELVPLAGLDAVAS